LCCFHIAFSFFFDFASLAVAQDGLPPIGTLKKVLVRPVSLILQSFKENMFFDQYWFNKIKLGIVLLFVKKKSLLSVTSAGMGLGLEKTIGAGLHGLLFECL